MTATKGGWKCWRCGVFTVLADLVWEFTRMGREPTCHKCAPPSGKPSVQETL